jgi:hypothetical protein
LPFGRRRKEGNLAAAFKPEHQVSDKTETLYLQNSIIGLNRGFGPLADRRNDNFLKRIASNRFKGAVQRAGRQRRILNNQSAPVKYSMDDVDNWRMSLHRNTFFFANQEAFYRFRFTNCAIELLCFNFTSRMAESM